MRTFEIKIWVWQELAHFFTVCYSENAEQQASAFSQGLFAATKHATGREVNEVTNHKNKTR